MAWSLDRVETADGSDGRDPGLTSQIFLLAILGLVTYLAITKRDAELTRRDAG